MILIAYDGSDDSKAAIEQSAKLFPGEPTTVLTVWRRFIDIAARVGGGVGMAVDYAEIDRDSQASAEQSAAEGAEQASAAGLKAVAKAAVVDSTVAGTILGEAEALSVVAIVCGSRGLTGVKSLMLGSVSHDLLHHADRPVMVVPSPAIAQARAEHLLAQAVS